MASDPSRVYAPPIEDRGHIEDTDALARDHRRVVWLHLGAWIVLLVLTWFTAALLGFELWTREGTLEVEVYSRAFEAHSVAGVAVMLGPPAGIAALIVVPARLQRSGFRWQWLAYVSLAAWITGTGMLLFGAAPSVDYIPGNIWGIGVLVGGLACLAVMVVVELATNRPHWREAPLVVFGIGLGAVLQLVAFARSTLQFLGPRVGIDTFGSGLTYLLPLVFPVALGIAGDMLERVGGKVPPRPLSMIAIALFALTPWIPIVLGIPAALAVPVTIVCVVVWWLLGHSRGDPRIVASVIAIVLAVLTSAMTTLLESLSVDIHLHDTYFVTAHVHFAGATGLAVVLALFFDIPGRTPRRGLGSLGLALLFIALGVAFATHANLGQSGMPRRYHTYVPQFEQLFQLSAVASILGALGLLIVVAALLVPRRRRE